jgi:hypothetical protein
VDEKIVGYCMEKAREAYHRGRDEQSRDETFAPVTNKVARIGGYSYDNFGGVDVSFYGVEAETEEQAIELLEQAGVTSERCQHEYDCCAHYYGGHPELVEKTGEGFIYKWTRYQNV